MRHLTLSMMTLSMTRFSDGPIEDPIECVHFNQNVCAGTARDLHSTNFCTKEEKHAIVRVLDTADVAPPTGANSRKSSATELALNSGFDIGGISHHSSSMEMTTGKRSKGKKDVTVLLDYDIAADAKNRISLRGANTKYFHVLVLSNGSYMLEPRVLVPPDAVPARTLKLLNRSVANLKKGKVSPPIDLSSYQKG
jgi:hypothetical protein